MADPGRIDSVIVELRPGVFSRQVGKSHTRHLSQIILDGVPLRTVEMTPDRSMDVHMSTYAKLLCSGGPLLVWYW